MAEIAPRVPIRTLWSNARSERNYDQAAVIADQIFARNPQDDFVRRGTARLLEALARPEEAAVHWRALRDANSSDFEAAFHCARAEMARGMKIADAVVRAAPDAGAVFQGALVDALLHPAPALEGEFKHVAIAGVSFCGSTLLDRVLGGLPGVKSTGESHWITKVHADNRYCEIDMSVPLADAKFVPCTVCGAGCEVLSRSFRRSLAADNTNWYRKIAQRHSTQVLVSADKGLRNLLDKDPLLDLSALVVFKSPEQAWRSQLNKLPVGKDRDYYDAECAKYVSVWAKNYRTFLDHFKPQGTVAFLNFDAFTKSPETLLRAVCARLELAFDPGVLHRTVPGHAIGGNGGSMKRLRANDYGVVIEQLPDPALEPAHQAIIADSTAMQQTWCELMSRHRMLENHANA